MPASGPKVEQHGKVPRTDQTHDTERLMQDGGAGTRKRHRQPQSLPLWPHPAPNMPSGILERIDGGKDVHQACDVRRPLAEVIGRAPRRYAADATRATAGTLEPIDAHARGRLPFREHRGTLREQQPLRFIA